MINLRLEFAGSRFGATQSSSEWSPDDYVVGGIEPPCSNLPSAAATSLKNPRVEVHDQNLF
eukprot:m.164495 g.164495  ORF g.164495 m.164495 type:complete len:61 (+) comp14657_c0_seq4:4105-4287(+)